MTTKHVIRPSTQAAIIEAAIAVFNENPSASISEVALRAGVGRATLHRHYKSRDALIDAISVHSIDETNAAVLEGLDDTATVAEQLAALFAATVPLGDRYNFLSLTPSKDKYVRQRYAEQLKWLRQLVDRMDRAGMVRSGLTHSWVIAQIDQLIWTAWRKVSKGRLAAADAAQLALDTLLSGVAGTGGDGNEN